MQGSKLKSTHISHGVLDIPPLPHGWTEHKAPTGHSYYYNADTKQSTYKRPLPEPIPAPTTVFPPPTPLPYINAQQGFNPTPYFSPSPFIPHHGQNGFGQRGRDHHARGGFRGEHSHHERRKQPEDRPRTKHPIPNCSPWVLVKTKLGRRFVHNLETKESLWRFPPDVMKGVVEYDRLEREKKERLERGEMEEKEDMKDVVNDTANGHDVKDSNEVSKGKIDARDLSGSSDEYEEVEVTDDEGEEDKDGNPEQNSNKNGQPVEFNEDDIAFQLAALGEAHGLDPGEYGDDGDWEEGAEGLPLTDEDAKALFYDLLNDHHVSPFATWDSVISNDQITADDRYVALPTTKARKEIWDEWCKLRAAQLKTEREATERADPRIQYMAFLSANATPSLYWAEFRRKYRKEPHMRDSKLSDKEREKLYRDLVARLKLPSSTRKSDFSALLKLVPLAELNRGTLLAALPSKLLVDVRFAALPAATREPLLQAYISTLPPAPENNGSAEEEEGKRKQREERERREEAMKERERRVQAEKQRAKRQEQLAKGMLREGEMEIERAMKVSMG